MKSASFLLLLLFLALHMYAQQDKAFEYGLDTVLIPCSSCKTGKIYEYFSIGGKYPESALSLRQRANARLNAAGISMDQNGFITFRFTVNNDGVASAYHLFLLDALYHPVEYDKKLISELYSFVQDLKQWKTNLNGHSGPVYLYHYYLSFQFKNGKIISVAP